MKTSTQRNFIRGLHIAVGSIIATFIYSPFGQDSNFQLFTKAVIIPLTILSGIWLWKGHLIKKYFKPSPKTMILLLCMSAWAYSAVAQQIPEANPEKRWGAEFSPIGAGVFRLFQAKATYLINPASNFKGEIGLGILLQPESKAKTSESFNKDGLYSAYMASLAYRQYFWKGLHFEEVVNLGYGGNRDNIIDGKHYSAFLIFTQTFLGYKFNLIRSEKFQCFLIGQGGFGYVPLNTNPWPRQDNTSLYGLGDLKIGINF